MAQNPSTQWFLKMKDYSREIGTLQVRTVAVDATNVADLISTPLAGDALNFYNTIDAMTNGSIQEHGFTFRRKVAANAPASSLSRRETKWLVQFYDQSTFANYTVEIPCADVSDEAWFKQNTDEVDLSIAPFTGATGYKAYLEAFMVSPDGGDITITNIMAVGRNL